MTYFISLKVSPHRALAVWCLFCLCFFCQTLCAADYANYDIYRGDVDADGDSDYYFHSDTLFLNIGGGMPFHVPGPPPFALYFDPLTKKYSAPAALALTATQINALGLLPASPNSDYLVAPDLDGNYRQDMVIQGEGNALDSLVLLAVYNQLPSVATIPASGVLTLASGAITIADFDGDEIDDLYIERFGNFSSANYHIAYANSAGRFINLQSVPSPLLPGDVGNPVVPLSGSSLVAATQGSPTVNAQGAAQYQINLVLPPALGNIKPALSLDYNSRRGTGEMGMGWSVSGLSVIHRCAPSFATEGYRGATLQTQAERLCLDGEKLVAVNRPIPVSSADYWSAATEYRTERDSFLKIVSYGTQGSGPLYFKVWQRDGTVLEFGATEDSRLLLPGHGSVDTWGLNKGSDTFGNTYSVTYGGDRTQGEYYVSYIAYEPGAAIRFDYIDRAINEGSYRADQPRGYIAGGLISSSKLLEKVTTYINVISPADPNNGTPVREYHLDYERGENTDRFRLATLTECGYNTAGTQASCARPTTFDWQAGEQGFETPVNLTIAGMAADANPIVVDLNNDSYQDVLWAKQGTWHIGKGTSTGYTVIDSGLSVGAAYASSAQPLRIDHRVGLLVAERKSDAAGVPWDPVTIYYSVWYLILFDIDNPGSAQVKTIFDPGAEFATFGSGSAEFVASVIIGDFNGDGLDDFYISHSSAVGVHTQHMRKNPVWDASAENFTLQIVSHFNYEETTNSADFVVFAGSLTDVDQDGFHDIVIRKKITDTPTELVRRLIRSTGTTMALSSDWMFPRGDGEDVLKPYRYVFKFSKESGGFFNRRKLKGKITVSGNEVYQNTRNGFFTDLNGDGLSDYVVRLTEAGQTEGTWRFYLNQGGSFGPQIDTGVNTGAYVNQLTLLMDYDRDGILDFAAQRPDGSAWRILLTSSEETFSGSGVYRPTLTPLEVDPFDGQLNSLLNYDVINDQVPIATDINNDAIPDIIYNHSGTWKVMYGKAQQPDLMIRVTDGFGAVVEFDYHALTSIQPNGDPIYIPENNGNAFPQIDETVGLTVVKTMRLSNGVGSGTEAFNAQTFQYQGAKLDLQGRGFLGFSTTTITDSRTGFETQTTYHQSFPYTGLPQRVTVRQAQGAGSVLSDSIYTYNTKSLNANQTQFPYLDVSYTEHYEGTAVPGQQHTWQSTDNTVDDWGNLTAQTTAGGWDVVGSSLPTTTYAIHRVNTVSNDTTSWLLGFVTKNTTTYQAFDGELSKTVITEFTQQPGTVLPATQTDFANSEVWLTTTYQRDAVGNVVSATATGGDIGATTAPVRTLFSQAQYQDALYPTALRNALNALTTVTYDKRFGVIDSVTDPNTVVTQHHYNPFGQLTETTRGDGSQTRITTHYCDEANISCPPIAVYRITREHIHPALSDFQGSPRQSAYYNSLNRLVRTETMDFENTGKPIRVDWQYDVFGRPAIVTVPYVEGETSLATCETDKRCTTFDYDLLGRQTRITRPDDSEVLTTYGSDLNYPFYSQRQVTVIAPDNTSTQHTTQRYINSLGQLALAENANGVAVRYLYDAQGFAREVVINDDSTTRITRTYDLAGNPRSITDPDAGTVNHYYDAFGQLRQYIQAPGTADQLSTEITYDHLGRRLSQTTPEGTSTWQYDTQKVGLLHSVSGVDFAETYTYDTLSRLQYIDTTLTGSSQRQYQFSYHYDAFSRPETLTYPSGLKVRQRYHTTGYLDALQNDSDQTFYWKIKDTNSLGQVIKAELGNGLVTETAFNPATGLVDSINTGDGVYNTLQALGFAFDSNGNLRSRTSQRQNSSGAIEENLVETFTYDNLNRLLTATTTGLNGGDRSLAYNYDPLGNLTYRSDVGSYSYAHTNGAGVHGVTNAGGKSFAYDAYGNITQNDNTTLTYTSFNKPSQIQGEVTITFKYGPDFSRFYQAVDGKEIYYLAGGAYEEIIDGGVVTQNSYLGSVLMHSQTESTQAVHYLHRDHLGSVETVSDGSGNRVERLAFAPYGKRRMEDWTEGASFSNTTSRGFTGHEHLDDVDLIHMGGRVYDPTVGKFLSPDPIVQNPTNSQSYNRYSYVFNNPLSLTDPSGFSSCGPLDGDCGDNRADTDPTEDRRPTRRWSQDSITRLARNLGEIIYRHHATIAANKVATDNKNQFTFGNDLNSVRDNRSGVIAGAIAQEEQGGCNIPMACAGNTASDGNIASGTGALVGYTGFVLSDADLGRIGITSKNNLKYSTMGWGGNQYVVMRKVADLAQGLTPLAFGLESYGNFTAWNTGGSNAKFAINQTMTTVSLRFPLIGASYTLAPVVGPTVLDAAIRAGPNPSISPPGRYDDLRKAIENMHQ